MKLRVNEIGGSATRDDGLLSLGVKDKTGNVHTIEFPASTRERLLLALLASGRDPASSTSTRFRPVGLGRFALGDDVGISFLLGPQIGLHVVLGRPLANALQNFLATFDDPSTWDTSKPN